MWSRVTEDLGRDLLIGALVLLALAILFGGWRRRSGRPFQRTEDRRPSPGRDRGSPSTRLVTSVFGWFLLAVLVAAGAITGLLAVLGWPGLPAGSGFGAAQLLELLKIALAVVAGIGGVVLLAVNFRKQRFAEAEHHLARRRADAEHRLASERADRERTQGFNERFGAAAEQLAHDNAAVRLAGVYAMAGLADDWEHQRQECADVLCGYLRLVPAAESGPEDEVRQAILRVLRNRLDLRTGAAWSELSYDFTGVWFTDADFEGLRFDGDVTFDGARFEGDTVSFLGTVFGGRFDCRNAVFRAKRITFAGTDWRGQADFTGSDFAGDVIDLTRISVTTGELDFQKTNFTTIVCYLQEVTLRTGTIRFDHCALNRVRLAMSISPWSVRGTVAVVDSRFTDCVVLLDKPAPDLPWLELSRLELTDSVIPGYDGS